MKLVEGRTLAELLAERADPGEERQHFLGIFEQVCQAFPIRAHVLENRLADVR